MISIILIVLLIAVVSWREVQILIDRGSWKAEDYHKLFWYIHWESKWKNFDSFHVASGLFVLILVYILYTSPNIPELLNPILALFSDIRLFFAFDIIIYWFLFHWLRNIFMHIVFKVKPEWKYLSPIRF